MTIDLLQSAAKLKDLIEEVAKTIPFPCNIVMNVNDDEPEIVIDEWVVITLGTTIQNTIGNNELINPIEAVIYIVGYMEFHPSTREEPEDSVYEDSFESTNPWLAIQDTFKLLLNNNLEHAMENVRENQAIKEEQEEQKLVKDAMKDVMNQLIDPLKVAFNNPNLRLIP
jgi:hypothetical protein